MAELPEQEMKRVEQFKQQAFAHFEELTGLTFDRKTGLCTTPGKVEMEGELKERWAALVTQIGAEHDAEKGEQLLREAGKFLREAVQQGETGATDGKDRQSE